MTGTSIALFGFFLLATIIRDGRATEVKDTWVPREGAKSIALAIGTGNRTWDTTQNMVICDRARFYLPYRGDIPDYTEPISLALKALAAFGGGSIQLGIGSYPVSAPIELYSGTCISGSGSNVTTIKLLDNAAPFGTKAGLLRANKVEYIYVGSLTLDGNSVSQGVSNELEKSKRAGMQFTLANFVYIKDVIIKHNPGNGLNIRGEGTELFSSHIGFEQVFVHENGGDAISLTKAAYVSIIDSTAGQNGRHGIILSSSKHAVLRAVEITKNDGSKTCGIAIRDSTQDVLVEKVSIQNATQAGVCARDSDRITIKNSTVENLQSNLTYCYHVRTTTNFDAQENTCRILSNQDYNTDESIVAGLPSTLPSNDPTASASAEPPYIIINLGV